MLRKVDSPLTESEEQLVYSVIGCAIDVHRELGPGFKESIYHQAFCLELDVRGLPFEREKNIVVKYKNWEIPGQRIDLIIAGLLVVELKAVPKLRRIHRAQLLSYMKAVRLPIGLLLNFNSETIRSGMIRVVRSEFRKEQPETSSRP